MNRLRLWCSVDKCQAGAQKGRSCIEQVMTLRLLIDFVKCKNKKLYVLFIDFSKAYDRVPRDCEDAAIRQAGTVQDTLLVNSSKL